MLCEFVLPAVNLLMTQKPDVEGNLRKLFPLFQIVDHTDQRLLKAGFGRESAHGPIEQPGVIDQPLDPGRRAQLLP